ncbi:cytochrome P450 2P7 [Danio rerio]|uniref:Cytochrome P450 2P7 n=1 Tax=Danio rerio TaxID=7955 RepID=Q5TZ75_DANRE|nr:cytochrome P450 2P7 [Danio rerio]AAI54482.1 Cytochrome P450, family 2, subfamily J, polypeptide 24 [Danio rerio]AAI63056.1 Cytochrome P450, family 2, subfamily J, polypeptide 24 [Danio rerio]AAI63079.1 Cytochrome P450, family 2, subfamily J, polypeptide 24 [Danio rerio]|eukprot:NP_001076518.1 cytochrome P450, family 2, subfamily P, polypeptide 7 [Danio rerio]
MDVLQFYKWLDIKTVLVFLVVFLFLSDYIRNKSPKNFPPGPWSLPFIGHIHHIEHKKVHLQFLKFAEKYGKIFSIRLFGPRIVVLDGYKLVKEVYLQQGDNLADRPILPMFYDITEDKGLIGSNGYKWKHQRRFALSTFRTFGLGKKSLEPSILLECSCLNDAFSNEQGRPFDPRLLLNNAVSNVICALVFSNRFDYSDHHFQTLLKHINEVLYLEGTVWAQLYNFFPWLMRRLPGPHQKIFVLLNKVIDFVREKVNEHRVDYDPSNPRDYIDCFLAEMEKLKDDTAAGFDVENLCICTLDLFVAGTETTSTTLYWGLLYIIKYPEIQAKVQQEIDAVVGGSRQPSVSDRDNMPYTNAVIHEIQRMGNIVPLNVFRITVEDTQIGEYSIPKGTLVIGSLTSVLFDESEWETPHSFNPGHFLDAEGKFRRRDAFLPFSLGKRVCLGEQLARMELFLFFSSLLQRFTFSPPAGVEPSLDYKLGGTHSPQPYKLCAVPR